ncbi:MAG: DUF3179 domain-containing protein [Candidatus Aenigmarchaeota archaeon]|nr:DUF3179 domain-containing protein [Candidatus Aenigmarchaeota archaeon]
MTGSSRMALGIAVVLIAGAIAFIELQKPQAKMQEDENVGLSIGKTAPDFQLETIDGKKVHLKDFRGRAVILNFWASWCPPCRVEMPEFQQAFDKNKDKLVVVGVNLQEARENAQAFVDKNRITFPILLDPKAEVKDLYGVFTQPVTYFIDKEGKIVDKKFGQLTGEEIDEKIGRLIGEGLSKANAGNEEIKTLPDGTKYIIHPDKFLSGGPPKDGIPSIDNPKFVSVKESEEWMEGNDLVLGIVHKGVARAYPFKILVYHEIVNDEIAGDPILITYCPLCQTGLAFERRVNGQAVEFGVSGKLYNSELLMYDRLTESYWPQSLGKAVYGKLTGTSLKKLPIDVARWKGWKEKNAEGQVLSRDTGFLRDYGRDPYGGYYDSRSVWFPLENEDKQNRLHPKERVIGIEANGKYKAYTLESIRKGKVINDAVGGKSIAIFYDPDLDFARAFESDGRSFRPENGKILDDKGNEFAADGKSGSMQLERLIAENAFWFAWYAFHPDTDLYKLS